MKSTTAAEQIIIFGFGAQGSAQALNLRDSRRNIGVCLRPESQRLVEVREAGLALTTNAQEAARGATVAALLVPDGAQAPLYHDVLEPFLPRGAMLVFAHGFAVHYRQIVSRPDLDVVLVAPMAQGATVRSDFAAGGSVPIQIAVAQDATGHARERAQRYAEGISHGPFIATTFAEEVESDLFAEQAVLCGGMPELVRTAFETLVDAGVNPEIACLCCLKELRAIVAVMDRHGIAGLYDRISDTARYGALTRGTRIIGVEAREEMRRALAEIRSGTFAQELIEETRKGHPRMKKLMEEKRRHPIEEASKKVLPR